jgi:Concanavalin A-like lectin/glucanases superfamily
MKNPKIFGSTAGVTLLRENQSTPANGIAANITGTYNTGHMLSAIKRCYLANTEVESISAPELVTNGTFDVDTSGWAAANGTFSLVAGKLRITGGAGGSAAYAEQFVATVIGKAYSVSCTAVAGTSTVYLDVRSPTTIASNIFIAGATSTRVLLRLNSAVVGDYGDFDNVTLKEVIADRSYKAAGASIYGTLTKALPGNANQLVAYSGFSAANYIQEPYSADLDMGTGDLSVSAWVNYLAGSPQANLLTFPEQFDNGVWIKNAVTVTANATTAPDGTLTADKIIPSTANSTHSLTAFVPLPGAANIGTLSYHIKPEGTLRYVAVGLGSGGAYAGFDLASGTVTGANSSASASISAAANGFFRVASSSNAVATVDNNMLLHFRNTPYTGSGPASEVFAFDGIIGVSLWGAKLNAGAGAGTYTPGQTAAYNAIASILDRSAATGPVLSIAVDMNGKLVATAFDGTTTRTVTTAAAYNTGTYIKTRLNYSAGKLAINVNGIEVASVVGAPLLTLNNAAAVLTIGNSRTLDAAFPGSITLAKISATVPTPEQAVWMYEQEKQMFRDGAQITLPAATAVLDLAYDEQLDKWVAIQAGNESSFTGLIRTATGTPSAGSFSKVSAQSGVKLMARTTTSPGVDVTVPAYGLREELVRRGEAAAKASKTLTVFDFDAIGFTATTTNTSNQLTIVASVVGTPYIGMGITGTGIPANTTISGINGATYMMSAAATATGTVIALGQSTFTLSAGWTTTEVLSAGNSKREGATKDFVRTYDGFKETIKFAVAPGSATWVQLTAKKE